VRPALLAARRNQPDRSTVAEPADFIAETLRAAGEGVALLRAEAPAIAAIATRLTSVLRSGGRVYFCGNGGSAADAQHLAGELSGRFLRDRAPLPALALAADAPSLTAIANDYGYEQVFARTLRAQARPGDALVALSTSGRSANVLAALAAAREIHVATVGFAGPDGGAMAAHCDLLLRAPARTTPRIQELHMLAGHIICEMIERALFPPSPDAQ